LKKKRLDEMTYVSSNLNNVFIQIQP